MSQLPPPDPSTRRTDTVRSAWPVWAWIVLAVVLLAVVMVLDRVGWLPFSVG
jgi:predicted membrane metal-binding protein